jgi:hypothetical protein
LLAFNIGSHLHGQPVHAATDRATATVARRSARGDIEETAMRKALPDKMFVDPESSRLGMLRSWVLDQQITEIDMNERQFWQFAALQPLAEKPWTTFMGRLINVPDMPEAAQKHLGIFNKNSPGMI